MEKYSCSYGGTNENFVILNNEKCNKKMNSIEYGIFCVVQNILQRGTPTNPSEYLKSIYGEQPKNPIYLVDDSRSRWNVIKGDDEHIDYPAELFFDTIFPKHLGEYSFVRNLILPEASFEDVLEKNTELDGQQVDFYFPQMKTVFEIDGSSHNEEVQKTKDAVRDKALAKENIKVVRIKSSDIKRESNNLISWLTSYKEELSNSEIINQYKETLSLKNTDVRVMYDAVMRLQMVLLSCLKSGKLRLTDSVWNIQVIDTDITGIEDIIYTAYHDIKLWISAIVQLLKVKVMLPEIRVNDYTQEATIFIDFSMFQRYADDIDYKSDCIYVRTDYFYDKNYFEVAFSDTLQYQFDAEDEKKDFNSFKFLLQNLFGFAEFREGQLPIIKNVLERKDTIGILPTGTGKSMCYQFSALLQPGVTIVVVPIISLMMDQKRGMDSKGITRTNYISSVDTGEEKDEKLRKFMQGQYQFMWMSPERFQNKKFREALIEINRSMNFSLGVIDEVHCLSEWGHDFRVSYLTLISTLRAYCPEACLLGLTATASQAVLNDLKVEFENDGSGIKALQSMDRKELNFRRVIIHSNHERKEFIQNVLRENGGTYEDNKGVSKNRVGLVFCPTVKGKNTGCLEIQNALLESTQFKQRVEAYHGQLSMEKRGEIQRKFMSADYTGALVCTKAFGMGIDKENVKYTIHVSLPQSIESFYQEAGRAGRDEDKTEKSYCFILYKPEDGIDESQINKIFQRETTVTERRRLSDELSSDLNTIMYLWNSNKKEVDEEYKNISDILKQLYRGNTTLSFGEKNLQKTLEDIENALYKLSLLNVVHSWTVEYITETRGVVDVDYIGLDDVEMEKSLMKYVRKYDAEFRLDENVTKYKKYYEILNGGQKRITQLIKILLEWGNDNILYNRLQSTYNMMQFCQESVSDEEFRAKINDYFRYSEQTVIFDSVIQNPLEYKNWFDVFWNKDAMTRESAGIITREKAISILSSLSRYLESYGNNTGLNYLCGMLRLLCGEFKGTEGEWRLNTSIQSVKEILSEKSQREILNWTLDIAKNFAIEEKDMLSQMLLQYYPEMTRDIFDKIQDRVSLSLELDKWAQKAKYITEEKIKWNI